MTGEPVKSCGHHDMSPRCVSPFHHFAVSLPRQLPRHQAAQHHPALSLHRVIFTTSNASPPCPTSPVAHQHPAASLHKPVVTNTMPRHLQVPQPPVHTPLVPLRANTPIGLVVPTPHKLRHQQLSALQAPPKCLSSPANVFVKPCQRVCQAPANAPSL